MLTFQPLSSESVTFGKLKEDRFIHVVWGSEKEWFWVLNLRSKGSTPSNTVSSALSASVTEAGSPSSKQHSCRGLRETSEPVEKVAWLAKCLGVVACAYIPSVGRQR